MPCTPIMAFAIDDTERALERILATSGLATDRDAPKSTLWLPSALTKGGVWGWREGDEVYVKTDGLISGPFFANELAVLGQAWARGCVADGGVRNTSESMRLHVRRGTSESPPPGSRSVRARTIDSRWSGTGAR